MARYTEADRQLVQTKRQQGMTYKAISAETGIPYGSTVQLANRADPYDIKEPTSADLPEVQGLYSSISTTQTQMKVLLDSISNIHDICKRDTICDLVKEMTSIKHGLVLDNIYKATVTEVDMEFLDAIPQLLMRMFNSIEIEPVLRVGDLMKITLAESLRYEYQGSDFDGETDTKLVKVQTTGWSYRGDLVSPARVTEVQ